ncbi:Ig-like domain-containing protein, partial [Paenisporosarcina sp. NPDC076907]
MKSILMKVGFITFLMLLCWTNEEAFAESTWTSKCSSFGEIQPNQNPTLHHMNCLLTNAALEAKIPPEVVKAVVSQENGNWKQFDDNGQPVISGDDGYGLMQITNQQGYDQEKLKYDIIYNIQAGVEILSSMYYLRTDLPKIIGIGPEVIENWYFPVMAYNGTKPSNSPLYQSSGLKNTNAYQEEVFVYIEKDSYLNDTKLGQFPFNTADFEYDTTSSKNILFKKMEYTLTEQMHASAYHFQRGDKVSVTADAVKLRSLPSSKDTISSVVKFLPINTTLIIEGNFLYEQHLESENKFVWYPVKTEDQKFAGYISSAYITKNLDAPVIDPLDDNDVLLTGKAPANVTLQIMNGTKLIGSSVSNTNGYFKSDISAQKAGAQLIVFYKDKLNALSPSKTITVLDKTAPLSPSVNMVNNKATKATGKTEADATVTVTIAGKAYSKKAD